MPDLVRLLASGVHDASLAHLDVRGNCMAPTTPFFMALATGNHSALQTLILRENELTDSGIDLLCKEMFESAGGRLSANLTSLDLHCVGMGDDGLLSLAASVHNAPRLAELNIGYNSCTKLGLGAFARALLDGACSSLSALVFQGNRINHPHVVAMAAEWGDGLHRERCTRLLTTQFAS